jgi:hypothetical protein
MSAAPTCPYCNGASHLTDSAVIYGRSYGPIYLCEPCDAYVGCHKGTTTPLGRLADAELRKWKKLAHAAFDPTWERVIQAAIDTHGYAPKGIKHDSRGQAYRRLAQELGIEQDACHIGMFDVELWQAHGDDLPHLERSVTPESKSLISRLRTVGGCTVVKPPALDIEAAAHIEKLEKDLTNLRRKLTLATKAANYQVCEDPNAPRICLDLPTEFLKQG